jgi:choline dehydrogenase-like flavoprotein
VHALPGLSTPVVRYRLEHSDMSRLARGLVALAELLLAAGATRLYPSIRGVKPVEGRWDLALLWDAVSRSSVNLMTIHLFSSVGMGQRRDLTGADSHGRVWGLDNLWVNDASLLPDAPGVNPQGTIMALASRNCERFLEAA